MSTGGHSDRRWRALAACGACVLGFAAVAITLRSRPGRLDAAVLDWLVEHRAGWLTTVARVVTNVGSPTGMVVLAVVLTFVGVKRAVPRPWLPIVVAAIADVTQSQLKPVFGRDRPPIGTRLISEASFAFPSGHAAMAMTVLGMAAVLAPSLLGHPRARGIQVALVTAALCVGASRLYLGVHWLSDVVGGVLLGGAFAALFAVLVAPSTPAEPVRQAPCE
ncbi:MAG: phosphatase PAP2 family protein [Acidimicrobiales bacterium]